MSAPNMPSMFGDIPGDDVTELAPPSFMPDSSDTPLPAHGGWDAMDGCGEPECM